MVFSSSVFLFLFLPMLLLCYNNPWITSLRFKNGLLLGASLFFYAWGEPVFVFLMIFSIVVTWAFGVTIDRKPGMAKRIVIVATIYYVGLLFVFKYLSFICGQFHFAVRIGLPIGISFFSFQMMSYLFDLYYKRTEVQRDVFKVALYVSLFPQLIAGPIIRYNQIECEINSRNVSRRDLVEGMERFIMGLAKKVLLANYLAEVSDAIYDVEARSVALAWLGAIAYTLQIYFDFSGYSDMAIGLGRMFGFHFAENFKYPYISKNVTEFWRRWHISLSGWFRDYVYIPLGGNRVSKKRAVANLFIVWCLTGIWHGANWTFLAWRLFYFVVLMIEKTGIILKRGIVSHLYTMAVVITGWVIFRSNTLKDAMIYLGNMIGITKMGFADEVFFEMLKAGVIVCLVGFFCATPAYSSILKLIGKRNVFLEEMIRSIILGLLFFLSIVETVTSTYSPFIYFNF